MQTRGERGGGHSTSVERLFSIFNTPCGAIRAEEEESIQRRSQSSACDRVPVPCLVPRVYPPPPPLCQWPLPAGSVGCHSLRATAVVLSTASILRRSIRCQSLTAVVMSTARTPRRRHPLSPRSRGLHSSTSHHLNVIAPQRINSPYSIVAVHLSKNHRSLTGESRRPRSPPYRGLPCPTGDRKINVRFGLT